MCMLKNADGTNKIVSGNEKYIVPTNKCMWKYPTDATNRVKTRLKAKNEPPVGYKEVDKYFATKYFIHGWLWERKVVFLNNKIFLRIYNVEIYLQKVYLCLTL